jgi:hypothetical protein
MTDGAQDISIKFPLPADVIKQLAPGSEEVVIRVKIKDKKGRFVVRLKTNLWKKK